MRRLADTTIEHFGGVDLVCNNAGVFGAQAPGWEQDVRTWQWLVSVKLMGVIDAIRTVTPLLLERGTGHIHKTASAGGLMPLPSITPYNTTMHAVVGLSETLDIELRGVAASR